MDAPRDGRATEFDETLRLIREGQERAWSAVNVEMIKTYAALGAFLRRKVREEGWGQIEVQKWADWLAANSAGGIGFSTRNLMQMKTFHESWTETGALPELVYELSWSCHLVLLEHCVTAHDRAIYLNAALREKWSPEELKARLLSKV